MGYPLRFPNLLQVHRALLELLERPVVFWLVKFRLFVLTFHFFCLVCGNLLPIFLRPQHRVCFAEQNRQSFQMIFLCRLEGTVEQYSLPDALICDEIRFFN